MNILHKIKKFEWIMLTYAFLNVGYFIKVQNKEIDIFHHNSNQGKLL